MSKHRRKKINFNQKTNLMDHIANEDAHKRILEKAEPEKEEPPKEVAKFFPRKYKPRFETVQAYKIPEDSIIHCADSRDIKAVAGDFYVCLDQVQEFILSEEIFKKVFIIKIEE